MSNTEARTALVKCPDCGERIRIGGTIRLGREVVCSNCDAELQIVETDPVELDWATDDYDDEDEDEDW